MITPDFPMPPQAHHQIAIAQVDMALVRWRARKLVVLHPTATPVDVLERLHARMTARRQIAIRWIDLILVERHALSILYPCPVGYAWPGPPPP
jgi:hypothetical protein